MELVLTALSLFFFTLSNDKVQTGMPPLLPVTASSIYMYHNFLQVTVYTYERTKEDEAEQVLKKTYFKRLHSA
jgi:hypothetical protein